MAMETANFKMGEKSSWSLWRGTFTLLNGFLVGASRGYRWIVNLSK
jgi:hypothetical protein